MNLLSVEDLSELQVTKIFELARKCKAGYFSNFFAGKTFVLFFPESSLRTRITFEKGIRDLGGSSILFPPEALDKREELSDVIRYIENWSDGVVVRHNDFRRIKELAESSLIPVVNAMTSENHPCEILADLFSLSELRPDYRKLVYTFVGPRSNVMMSWMHIARVMNLEFHHVCLEGHRLADNSPNYTFHTELEPVLRHTDVILTDSLPENLRSVDYIEKYQVTLEKLRRCKSNVLLNPCPPFFRGEEVSSEAISSKHFVGYEFKKNLLYVHQAILAFCCGIKC